MRTIDTQEEMVPWLLRELARSTPKMTLPSGFLIALAGVCAGLTYEPSDNAPLDLVPVIAPTNFHSVECGVKLVDLARALADAEALEPSGSWSKARLIRLMVKCLDARWLVIYKGTAGKPPHVRATSASPYSYELKVRVSLHTWRPNPAFFGAPTDKRKLRLTRLEAEVADLRKQVRTLTKRLDAVLEERGEAASAAQTAQRNLSKAAETISRQAKKMATLESRLARAAQTIQDQQTVIDSAAHDPLYRRVGLDQECPDFVLREVRRAYRKNLHPDGRPPHEKAAAEERFKDAEAVFDKIYAQRRLK